MRLELERGGRCSFYWRGGADVVFAREGGQRDLSWEEESR
jgi:hypothetical protein